MYRTRKQENCPSQRNWKHIFSRLLFQDQRPRICVGRLPASTRAGPGLLEHQVPSGGRPQRVRHPRLSGKVSAGASCVPGTCWAKALKARVTQRRNEVRWRRDKKQVWRPHVRTWGLSEANVPYWRVSLQHCWDSSAPGELRPPCPPRYAPGVISNKKRYFNVNLSLTPKTFTGMHLLSHSVLTPVGDSWEAGCKSIL